MQSFHCNTCRVFTATLPEFSLQHLQSFHCNTCRVFTATLAEFSLQHLQSFHCNTCSCCCFFVCFSSLKYLRSFHCTHTLHNYRVFTTYCIPTEFSLHSAYLQYNTTLLSLCREICFLARHLHKTFNTINNKTSTTQ